jgi:hypothetical protein
MVNALKGRRKGASTGLKREDYGKCVFVDEFALSGQAVKVVVILHWERRQITVLRKLQIGKKLSYQLWGYRDYDFVINKLGSVWRSTRPHDELYNVDSTKAGDGYFFDYSSRHRRNHSPAKSLIVVTESGDQKLLLQTFKSNL